MYQDFFGFKEKPFSLTPDPDFLYLSKQHMTALNMLEYGLHSQAGITVINGEVGSGKTTLVRRILQEIDQDVTVGLISNAHNAFGDLLQWVLNAFELDASAADKASRYQIFVDFLVSEYSQNRRTVLIIDEAQNLDMQTLEELRLLSNINVDKYLLLQLILVGQPELLELLQRPELRQLAQRVSVDYRLKPLKYKETLEYIQHRLEVAGGAANVFDKYAMAVIFYYSQGIPRLINTLCDFSLVYGFAEEIQPLTMSLVLDVIRDKLQGGIFPFPEKETNEMTKVRALILQQKGIDIGQLQQDEDEEELKSL
ncbi:MAG: AAA family ATPase [Dethiobacteria bacterium]|nr:AAA family ATPase [Dethiobacteria bacterium]